MTDAQREYVERSLPGRFALTSKIVFEAQANVGVRDETDRRSRRNAEGCSKGLIG